MLHCYLDLLDFFYPSSPEFLKFCLSLCPDGTLCIHAVGQLLLPLLCLPTKTIDQGLESHQTLSSLLVNPISTTSVPVILRRTDKDTCTCCAAVSRGKDGSVAYNANVGSSGSSTLGTVGTSPRDGSPLPFLMIWSSF